VVAGELDRPWEAMIGSEHLSCLLRPDRTGGQVIGTELREALRLARAGLGVRAVRAHGILSDDLGVYRAGRPHDFGGIDRGVRRADDHRPAAGGRALVHAA
jgi:xylan 1,4-beta-xylosidase